jgi:hypothetical protein
MERSRLLLVFLIAGGVFSDRVAGQQIEPPVLVGVGTGQKRMEQLSHLYAIDAKIVSTVAKIGTPILGRAFVLATTRTTCCDPAMQVSTNCWYCCDSQVICTNNADYGSLVAESTKVSDAQWKLIQARGLDSIEQWSSIKKLLEISPPREVSREDPKFGAFLKMMAEK